MAGRKRDLSTDEKRLWAQVARGFTPLKGVSPPKEPESAPPLPTPSASARDKKAHKLPAAQALARAAEKPKPKPLAPMGLLALDGKRAEKLAKGKLPIDGRLDLHGRTIAEAHADLHGHLSAAQRRGARCLLVITGKGRGGRGEEGGMLRHLVPRWLAEPHVRTLVVAVTPAAPHHGGAGAYYVYLRRIRE